MPGSSPATELTSEQREQFAADGYFVVKQALSSGEVERLAGVVDELFERHFESRVVRYGEEGSEDRHSSRANVIEASNGLIPLLDHPATFPLVLDLLGPYITLGLSEATKKRPGSETGDRAGFVHSDGGHAMSRTWVAEKSQPLLIKLHYFLTDCLAPEMGNFAVVPGSHRRTPYWGQGRDTTPVEAGAIPLLMAAGDCAIWTHSLWHGAMPNRSRVTRKTVTFGYNQMFIRALAEPPSRRLLELCSVRQRRLLGDLGPEASDPTWGSQFGYFYAPSDYEDIMFGADEP